MSQTPIDETHALQIQAGTLGRQAGHDFEDEIATRINSVSYSRTFLSTPFIPTHVRTGDPAIVLLEYIQANRAQGRILSATAISTGALATSEDGKRWLSVNGVRLSRCKSDLVLSITFEHGSSESFGISTKQCNAKRPTNAQLYFTTAVAFSRLLVNAGIQVSAKATDALRQFCGESGFSPRDKDFDAQRRTDPRRFFWEEIEQAGRTEWEEKLSIHQSAVFRLLLQKAYLDDLFIPDFLLHKTKRSESFDRTEVAIYSIDELVELSASYKGFDTRSYRVHKGSYPDPIGVYHQAPRFGIIQMQRGGQAVHPEQLQFNLEAGYFYKI